MDTIYALTSAAGRAGVAIVRISGTRVAEALGQLVGSLPPPRRASLRRLRNPRDGQDVDRGIVLWLPGPGTYTGEDMAELHIHGSTAVQRALFAILSNCLGLRPAEPGEFTRRAFDNGKLDLTAAEGLADLVNAETEAQRRQALRQLSGDLGQLYEGWRGRLMTELARVEAHIDFPDEGLPTDLTIRARQSLAAMAAEIERHLDDNSRGERLRDGLEAVILGPPNVGKSSLLNALAGRQVAIVSTRAGTTRDIIEARLELQGYPVTLADTAGLRASDDDIEQEGVRRAISRAQRADIKILMLEATSYPNIDTETQPLMDRDAIIVVSKADLTPALTVAPMAGCPTVAISAWTGKGLDRLLALLAEQAVEKTGVGPSPSLTRLRHRQALVECLDALHRALTTTEVELWCEDLRIAVRAVGRITGRVDVEAILDRIFAEFCIGK